MESRMSSTTHSEHGIGTIDLPAEEVSLSPEPDCSHLSSDDELMTAVAARAAACDAPGLSATGKMLWAIQDWYADLRDEKTAEGILATHTQTTIEEEC